MHSRLVLLFLVIPFVVQARISPFVPARYTDYRLVEKLEALTCAYPTFRTLIPQSFADLKSAIDIGEIPKVCQASEALLAERENLLAPGLRPQISFYGFALHNDVIALRGLAATVTPLFPLREGRATFNGANLYADFGIAAESGDKWGYAFAVTPGWVLGLDDFKHLNGRFYLHEGYVKGGYKWAELTLGRLAMRFGETAHGSLLLSGATKPLDVVKFTLRPHFLGKSLRFLGPVSFDTWYASQGREAFIPHTKLWAVSVGLRPATWLEVAFLHLNQFGGDGAPDLEGSDLLKMLVFAGSDDLERKRYHSGILHLGIWLPRHQLKVYSQFQFSRLTRLSKWLSQDVNTLLGVWVPRLGPLDVRLEYAHTVPGSYQSAFWRQGLSYEGTPLGHPLGPNAEGLYLDVGIPPLAKLQPSFALTYEARQKQPAPGVSTEWRYGGGFDLSKKWEGAELVASSRYAYVLNHAYKKKQPSHHLAAWLSLKYEL